MTQSYVLELAVAKLASKLNVMHDDLKELNTKLEQTQYELKVIEDCERCGNPQLKSKYVEHLQTHMDETGGYYDL